MPIPAQDVSSRVSKNETDWRKQSRKREKTEVAILRNRIRMIRELDAFLKAPELCHVAWGFALISCAILSKSSNLFGPYLVSHQSITRVSWKKLFSNKLWAAETPIFQRNLTRNPGILGVLTSLI